MKQILLAGAIVLLAAAPGPAAPEREVIVTIDAFQFMPERIEVKKGTTVTFINKDATPHTVSPESGALFAGGRLLAGESRKVTFKERGIQDFFCELHTTMRGKVIVR